MSTAFPFVPIPPDLFPRIGKPDSGTHIYRKEGPEEEMGAWFDLLSAKVGPTLSPGGVRMYCPVSRAAVHKRTKEGKLSIFLYHCTYAKEGLFGKVKKVRKSPYAYIPVSEVHAWRREIEERAVQRNEVTREELEGAKPDVDGDFLEWPVKGERQGLYDTLRGMGYHGPLDLALEALRQWIKHGRTDGVEIPASPRQQEIIRRELEKRERAAKKQSKKTSKRKKA